MPYLFKLVVWFYIGILRELYSCKADEYDSLHSTCTCKCHTGASCNDAFLIDSTCYKIHKEEKVRWFTAVNRCLSNNATLAVFDVNVRQYFPSSLLSDTAWIGLVKAWWTWPDLG